VGVGFRKVRKTTSAERRLRLDVGLERVGAMDVNRQKDHISRKAAAHGGAAGTIGAGRGDTEVPRRRYGRRGVTGTGQRRGDRRGAG